MISAAPFIDFSPPLSFASTLSLSISLFDQSFHFENVDRIFHCARLRNTVSARSRQRHRPCFPVSSCYFAPLKYAKHSPLPSKREIPSIRAYAHTSRMQISVRMGRARAIFHASLFSTSFHPALSIRFLLFVERRLRENVELSIHGQTEGLSLLTAAANE